ncbi:MarC family protein [Azohydromonas sediminis]|uniref:MarC family protein n=1 Tax=Azohydromonas sediminis TaxID=2259674 RepID=UPI000E64727A|nr:MarC family protein [Azohydromonas sediminis]
MELVALLKSLALVPVTLLPIINPLTAASVFVATAGHNRAVAKRLARQVAINAWFVLVASLLVGNVVLEFFGISLPIVRIGGGLLVAATAWRMLSSQAGDEVQTATAESASALSDVEVMRRSFFPITFPLTTGPGTIAASIALGAQLPSSPVMYVAGAGVAILGAAVTALVLYLVFANSARVLGKLGPIGTLVMMRLLAFMLLCIGIQFIWDGWAQLNGLAR